MDPIFRAPRYFDNDNSEPGKGASFEPLPSMPQLLQTQNDCRQKALIATVVTVVLVVSFPFTALLNYERDNSLFSLALFITNVVGSVAASAIMDIAWKKVDEVSSQILSAPGLKGQINDL